MPFQMYSTARGGGQARLSRNEGRRCHLQEGHCDREDRKKKEEEYQLREETRDWRATSLEGFQKQKKEGEGTISWVRRNP